MLNRLPSARRGLFVVLAAVAVAFVLVRPVCEAWFGHAGAGTAAAHELRLAAGAPEDAGGLTLECCASIGAPSTAAASPPAGSDLPASLGLALAALLFVPAIGASFAPSVRLHRPPPPAPQSFYLRSARILR
jgi:hypothetical protein